MTHEGVRNATKKAVSIAKEVGALISFDPNLREPLWESLELAKDREYGFRQCDILKISDNEIQFVTGKEDYDEGIAILQEKYQIPLILLTKGKDGSCAYYKEMRVEKKVFACRQLRQPEQEIHFAAVLWDTCWSMTFSICPRKSWKRCLHLPMQERL